MAWSSNDARDNRRSFSHHIHPEHTQDRSYMMHHAKPCRILHTSNLYHNDLSDNWDQIHSMPQSSNDVQDNHHSYAHRAPAVHIRGHPDMMHHGKPCRSLHTSNWYHSDLSKNWNQFHSMPQSSNDAQDNHHSYGHRAPAAHIRDPLCRMHHVRPCLTLHTNKMYHIDLSNS